MKKSILFLSALVLILAACTKEKVKESTIYTITATNVPAALNGDTIYLMGTDSLLAKRLVMDSVVIADGKFTFQGDILKHPTIAHMETKAWWTKTPRVDPIKFVLEPGNIAISFDSISTVGGTALNDEYQKLKEGQRLYSVESRKIYKEYNKVKDDPKKVAEIEKTSKALSDAQTAKIIEYIKANIGTHVGALTFMSENYGMKPAQKLEIISLFPEAVQASERIARIKNNALAQEATTEGKKFIDLKAKTMDGKDLALSEIVAKNKYTFVDFWASWCGPCIGEMPHLSKTYAEYKKKGFEIFGVSLDEDHDKWKEATKTHKVVWPQIVDPKGWGDLANAYGVEGIPYTVLIDQEGTIVATNLRGDALTKKLKELLK